MHIKICVFLLFPIFVKKKHTMERRDFMKALAGTGALIATSKLPLLAEDKPEVFPERGRYERLALCYATVEIGLEKPFSVLHISDTHLTAAYAGENEKKQTLNQRRTQTFGGRQEEAISPIWRFPERRAAARRPRRRPWYMKTGRS